MWWERWSQGMFNWAQTFLTRSNTRLAHLLSFASLFIVLHCLDPTNHILHLRRDDQWPEIPRVIPWMSNEAKLGRVWIWICFVPYNLSLSLGSTTIMLFLLLPPCSSMFYLDAGSVETMVGNCGMDSMPRPWPWFCFAHHCGDIALVGVGNFWNFTLPQMYLNWFHNQDFREI